MIEEYFKAVKTGCQYEQRQPESAHALLNALAVLVPVAWRLLLLRHLARESDTRPATDALTKTQVDVLKAVAKKPLPKRPTVRDALLAVAALGGHIKNNGEPGWQVLGRGYRDLLILEMGWQARGDLPDVINPESSALRVSHRPRSVIYGSCTASRPFHPDFQDARRGRRREERCRLRLRASCPSDASSR